jgi:HEPN domain-containing protein
MNERINELLKQSRTEYWTQYTPSYDYEKFAELIVQECLMKAIGAKIRGESIDTLIQNIKEDFGVQE